MTPTFVQSPALPAEAFAREDFTPYAERFCRRLGIDNELALKLLHKTQSAKNLGDLNTFLRDFMLDKPETFAAADRLVAEFADLNIAHQAVVTAREQIQTLAPAREEHAALQSLTVRDGELRDLRAGLDDYKQHLRAGLLDKRLVQLEAESAGKKAEEQSRQASLDNDRSALDDLHRQHLAAGGGQIEDLQNEKRRTGEDRDARLRKRDEAQAACRMAGWQLPGTPAEFAETVTAALRVKLSPVARAVIVDGAQPAAGDTLKEILGKELERIIAGRRVQEIVQSQGNEIARIIGH